MPVRITSLVYAGSLLTQRSALERRRHQSVVLPPLVHPVGYLEQRTSAFWLGDTAVILAEHGLQHDHVLL